uniref:Uncharacterized protein n=1 Tax=Aegilops tauschii subsp. strangulata TaxID=200361 RepID=A0A452XNK7_AEGTS
SATLLGPPVGCGAEACGDTVAVGAVCHAVHDPVTALLDPASGRLVELHPGLTTGGHSGDHGNGQASTLHGHHWPTVLLDHLLHRVQMAPGQLLRCLAPVQRVGPRRLRHAQAVAVAGDLPVLALHPDMQIKKQARNLAAVSMCIWMNSVSGRRTCAEVELKLERKAREALVGEEWRKSMG